LGGGRHKGRGAWEDALRVARAHGGAPAAHGVAYEHARTLGGEAGVKLLQRLGMLEVCIDMAAEAGHWECVAERSRALQTQSHS